MSYSCRFYIKLKDGSRGPLIARFYERLVVGERGSYIEFHRSQLDLSLIEVEPGQEYRLEKHWKNKAFYGWYRTRLGHRKVYHQYRPVDYADYRKGYVYIYYKDLIFDGTLKEG